MLQRSTLFDLDFKLGRRQSVGVVKRRMRKVVPAVADGCGGCVCRQVDCDGVRSCNVCGCPLISTVNADAESLQGWAGSERAAFACETQLNLPFSDVCSRRSWATCGRQMSAVCKMPHLQDDPMPRYVLVLRMNVIGLTRVY